MSNELNLDVERALFIAALRVRDNVPDFISDETIMAGEVNTYEWAGYQLARRAVPAQASAPAALPDLHDAIVNLSIPIDPKIPADAGVMLAYKLGHRDARHAAAELAAAAQVPAQGEKDAERLDWLEQMANKPGGLLLHDGGDMTGRVGLGLRRIGRTLRDAVDAAMKFAAPQPADGEKGSDHG